VLAAACAHSTAAWAESAEDRESARQFLDRGDEQVEKGDLEGALASYRAAHELMHVPTTGLEVARLLVKLGKLVEARDVALEVVRMPTGPKESRAFKVARTAAETMARELAAQIPSLRIELTPPGAADETTLEIDQRTVPLSALDLGYSLNPGAHRIRISATGYETASRSITLRPGESQTLRIELVPDATQTAKPIAKPKAPVAKAPPREAAGSLRTSSPVTPEDEGSTTWPQWLGFSLGGAGLIVGTVTGVLSLDRTRAASEHCTGNKCTPEARGDLDEAMKMANISNVGFGVAALGTAIGLTGILLSSGSSEKTSAKVHVTAGPGVAMLRCEGALW
jgi:PEGA domain